MIAITRPEVWHGCLAFVLLPSTAAINGVPPSLSVTCEDTMYCTEASEAQYMGFMLHCRSRVIIVTSRDDFALTNASERDRTQQISCMTRCTGQ